MKPDIVTVRDLDNEVDAISSLSDVAVAVADALAVQKVHLRRVLLGARDRIEALETENAALRAQLNID